MGEDRRVSEPTAEVDDLSGQQLLRLLPHRYPFLLLDRVVECIPGRYVRAYKFVSKSETFLTSGDGSKSLPRFLLLEALAQAAVVLTFRTLEIEPSGRELMFYAGIDGCAFRSTVPAGVRLDLRAQIARMLPSRGIGVFEAEATVSGQTVAMARLIAALRLG